MFVKPGKQTSRAYSARATKLEREASRIEGLCPGTIDARNKFGLARVMRYIAKELKEKESACGN